jgi:predicted Fe-S protein YdhL (DUF1289 family)
MAQWLLQVKPTINILEKVNYAFCEACKNGHLEVAQWLLQVSQERGQVIDILEQRDAVFASACKNGHLELAQWLLQVSKEKGQDINISARNNLAFRWACERTRLEVAKWLATLKPEYEILNEDRPEWSCNVLTDPEAIAQKIRDKNWRRRKTGVYLQSDLADRNILNVMPTDVAKIANSYLG